MIICGKKIMVKGRLIRIAALEADKYEFVEAPEPILDGLRQCGTRIDLFTFLQRLPRSANGSLAITPKYNYPFEWDNLAVLPVSTFDHWWTRQIRGEARNRARQASKKGVVVREVPFDNALLTGIWRIYNECPIRQGRPFPHYGIAIGALQAIEATFLDRSIFIGAFLENMLIGFAKLVADETRTQANLMNILSLAQHRDKAPTNALIAHAVRSCVEHKIPYLVYQNFSYGKSRGGGLERFKEVNGFQRVNVPRYYIPMSVIGSVAFRLHLHRRLIDRLPQSLAERMREVRAAWYRRKSQLASESF